MGFWRNRGISRRVLLVDKDTIMGEELRRVARDILHLKMHNSTNIKDAMDELRRRDHRVVIFEPYFTPQEDSPPLLREIRTRDIPLIVFSVLSSEEVEDYMDSVAYPRDYRFMQKPEKTSDVIAEIARNFISSPLSYHPVGGNID